MEDFLKAVVQLEMEFSSKEPSGKVTLLWGTGRVSPADDLSRPMP